MTGRQIMGVEPDQFVVGAFNANSDSRPSRKAWPEQLLAFSIFAKDHDDAVIYIHTDRHGAGANGLKMDELCAAVGLEEHQFKFVNQYAYRSGIPQEGLAALMSACDVGLAASYGEGFGLTVLELQSVGVRVIVNDFSSQPELVGDGWLTTGQPFYNPGFQNWWKAPSIASIVDSLEAAYEAPRGHSDKARSHAVQYDADLVYRQRWRPVLEAMAE
jgi:glycosyltransferase involved in cell wall biosynthesis